MQGMNAPGRAHESAPDDSEVVDADAHNKGIVNAFVNPSVQVVARVASDEDGFV